MSDPEHIFCPIRKEWVAALPEEYVRQRIISQMIEEKGFPISLIAVERPLKQLTFQTNLRSIPNRRVDVVCFAKNQTLCPLLTIECKAVPLSQRVINQVLGYNHFVKARFIAIVNQEEIRTGWLDAAKKDYTFVNYLPSYPELLACLR